MATPRRFSGRPRPPSSLLTRVPSSAPLARTDPSLEDFTALAGKHDGGTPARAYVCFDGVCDQPTDDPSRFRAKLVWDR